MHDLFASESKCLIGPRGRSQKYMTHYAVRSPHNTEMRQLHKMSSKGRKWTRSCAEWKNRNHLRNRKGLFFD